MRNAMSSVRRNDSQPFEPLAPRLGRPFLGAFEAVTVTIGLLIREPTRETRRESSLVGRSMASENVSLSPRIIDILVHVFLEPDESRPHRYTVGIRPVWTFARGPEYNRRCSPRPIEPY
jgi:hypothetical protein